MAKKKINVQYVAQLAKIKISSSEIKKFTRQLSEILDYVAQLKQVRTEKTPETHQTTGLSDVLRPDKVVATEILSQEQALSGTEKTHNNYFLVPGIFENKDE